MLREDQIKYVLIWHTGYNSNEKQHQDSYRVRCLSQQKLKGVKLRMEESCKSKSEREMGIGSCVHADHKSVRKAGRRKFYCKKNIKC